MSSESGFATTLLNAISIARNRDYWLTGMPTEPGSEGRSRVLDAHSRVREGLSFESFERLRAVLDLPASRAAELLQIPARTLNRRKEAKRFEPEESDRLVRLSRLVGLALQLFE